jgi:hypothetical protein
MIHRRAPSLVASLLLFACSGSTATVVGGSPDAGPGADGGATDGGPGGACPANVPGASTPCAPVGATCEYGGGDHLLCSTIARCQQGRTGQGAWFVDVPGTDCIPGPASNPAACPAAFGSLPTGSACPANLPSDCVYAEGMCSCASCEGDGGMQNEWACEAFPQPQGCPEPRPRIGSACTQEGQSCGYGSICGETRAIPYLRCQNGTWEQEEIGADCAVRKCGP